ncbi:UDP-sulfoquinovose synthase [Pseudodesulfovibrio profundus]|uniref:UDP-sulfoquinovose synthase n=1 Tax=Pseudodesulfovibrio profundus TaxID=57320 RepID=A0A2C8FE02_9BACT|nr:NAD-dependent epimerase/dehydratase family protein [Pseudodesulfovibrio profundus]SOB60771.1 UDP-sulfoquinovose synthase [Pseudodesulfovibrio profundus]
MRVLILGADGYLGWPTALLFSSLGHEVTAVDNYFRRHTCDRLDVGMLYPVPTFNQRAQIWHELSGYEIKTVICDLAEPKCMRSLFNGRVKYQWAIDSSFDGPPDVVIHYAEQPSAPYSMLTYETADETLINNLRVTNNLMFAIRDLSPSTHLVKLGTMGEYGTPNIDIEEGWLDIQHKGRSDRFLFPRQASSLYHTTKILDTDLLWFGVRMWDLKVTDLMQGPVYGIETDQTIINPRLKTIFNYDEFFGTIINRFIVQAVIEHPLTVYGKGGQTRGYLNIKDTLQCVEKAALTPPKPGEMLIYNQIMETFSVNELAEMVVSVGRKLGYNTQIQNVPNPRIEAEDHYYNPNYQALVSLGVKPHYLTEDVLIRMFEIVAEHADTIKRDVILGKSKW